MFRIQMQIEKKLHKMKSQNLEVYLTDNRESNFPFCFKNDDLKIKNPTALVSMISISQEMYFFNQYLIMVIRRLMNSDFVLYYALKFLWKNQKYLLLNIEIIFFNSSKMNFLINSFVFIYSSWWISIVLQWNNETE